MPLEIALALIVVSNILSIGITILVLTAMHDNTTLGIVGRRRLPLWFWIGAVLTGVGGLGLVVIGLYQYGDAVVLALQTLYQGMSAWIAAAIVIGLSLLCLVTPIFVVAAILIARHFRQQQQQPVAND